MQVRLRALEPEDLELLYRIENDATLWRYGTTTAPYSRFQLRQYIETSTADAFHDEQVRMAIECDGTTVGFVDLQNISALHARAEVGIVVLPEYQRKGIASEALMTVADYVKQLLHLHQLYAYVSADNGPSAALFRKAGYDVTALLKDWISTPEGWMDVSLMTKML